jgi:predicted oxidoreductase
MAGMNTQTLGSTDLRVTRLCYGAMRISGSWEEKIEAEAIEKGIRSLEDAVEAGYTFIDHAEIYGSTNCEMIHGLAVKRHPEWRDRLVVATKCGIRFADEPKPGLPHRYDFDAAYINEAVDASLRRLNVERIDLYQLHRPDYLGDPEEVAETFKALHTAGKVRYFGVSNFRPTLVAALQKALPFPLVSNQVEIHLLHLDPFTDGTLDQCLERKMTPLAWSPLAQGRIAAAFDEKAEMPKDAKDAATVERLRPVLRRAAQEHGVPPLAIVMAWLMRHPSKIIPIVGSTRAEAIRDAAKADTITLDRDNWYRILIAARGRGME